MLTDNNAQGIARIIRKQQYNKEYIKQFEGLSTKDLFLMAREILVQTDEMILDLAKSRNAFAKTLDAVTKELG